MFANIPLLYLVLALAVSIAIFIFILLLLLPGKGEKTKIQKRSEEILSYPTGITGEGKSELTEEMDKSVVVAILSKKIDELSKKLDEYIEEIRKIELEISRLTTGSGTEKEIFSKLNKKIDSLDEKIKQPVVEKTEISEMKNKLDEVITILKTLGS